jgi:ribosomal protein S18 acetylase RimI-like enzyme
MPVIIEDATAEDADAVVEMWLSLAAGQRSHGSHLCAEENREQIRDSIARHIVLDGLLIARHDPDGEVAPETDLGSEETATDDPDSDETTTDDPDSKDVAGDDPDADAPVGFVMFDLETGTYAQDVSRGVVRNLYVRPPHRQAGVGAALLDAAEASLAEAGADVAALEAMADNDRARSFYADHGYTPHRVEVEKPLGATGKNDTHTREG